MVKPKVFMPPEDGELKEWREKKDRQDARRDAWINRLIILYLALAGLQLVSVVRSLLR